MVLTRVDGQTRVSDVNADEGSPHDAGSNTELRARIQTRSRSPCPVLAEQERRPDSQGAWRLGQLSEELGQAVRDRSRRAGTAHPEQREELRKLRKENKVLRQERKILRRAAAFFAREDGIR